MGPKGFAAKSARGFSLVEMMIAGAVMGIVLTTAAPSLGNWVDRQRVSAVASQLASDLQFARSEAVLRNRGVRVSLLSEDGGAACYVIHTGAANQCRCNGTGPARCDGEAQQIKTVALETDRRINVQSNVSTMLFDPVHGTASPSATWRVVGPQGSTVHQVVNLMGRVRSCSPQGMHGYRAS